MRSIIPISIVMLVITFTFKSVAGENTIPDAQAKSTHSEIVANSSPISQFLLTQDITKTYLDNAQILEFTPQLIGEYNTGLLSVEAGIIESIHEASWNKYYFQGEVTLHQHNEFNISFMANIEQVNNFYYHSNQTSTLDYYIAVNDTEFNYSYGIVGSFTLSSAWQFSGGIIHSESLNEAPQSSWYGNENMALIGTSYSF